MKIREQLEATAKARGAGAPMDPKMASIAQDAAKLARMFNGSTLARTIMGDMNRLERRPIAALPPRTQPVELDAYAKSNLAEIGKAIRTTAEQVTAANDRAEAAERRESEAAKRERWWKVAALVLPIAAAIIMRIV